MTDQTIKKQIIFFMEQSAKKSFSMEEIASGLGLNKSNDFKLLVQTIATMEREKTVIFTKKGKIRLPNKEVLISGIFRANERGFGFVTIDAEEDDIYIAKENTNYAMDGDEVSVDVLHPGDTDKGAEGNVVAIQKRAITQIVGEFTAYTEAEIEETDLYGFVIPKDKKSSSFRVYIAATGIKPVDGSVVIATITHYPEKGYATSLEGIVSKVVGHKNDPGMDILSIVVAHGIPTEFPDEVMQAADQVPDSIAETDLIGRQDLRDQQIVTIDGADAKDLDDAVAVRKLTNGNYHLGVHIADVSYYVTEGSELDQEAYDRGTSVYLTDRVVPMIPQRLSNGICSLNPQVPRLTMSCEMEISPQGKIIKHQIFPSVIQTTARMTYTAVNQILAGQDQNILAEYQELIAMFKEMQDLHQILEAMRERRGAITFEDREAKVLVDEEGHPEAIELRTRGVAERMIESFMLAANETVAKHYSDLQDPFIYRIHEQPKEEKMQRFFDFAAALGMIIKGNKTDITPKALQNVLEQIKGKPEELVINTMMLRSMQQARYSEDNYGHYGLAAEYYTHFTSPIRRYPDLIVHRLIRSYAEHGQSVKEKWEQLLPEIADHSSQRERRAVEAERDVNALKKAEYMADHVGEEFDGVISSVAKFGLFVELPNTIEGMIHITQLKGDYYHFLENHLALVGERTGQTFKIGQQVTIRVLKADPETREIDFELVSAEEVPKLEAPKAAKQQSQRRRQPERKKMTDKKNTAKNKKKNKGHKPFYKDVSKKKKGKKKKTR